MRHTLLLALAVASLMATHAHAADLALTPAQTEGPYYPVTKPTDTDTDLTRVGSGPQANGPVLALDGNVLDPAGRPIDGALIEIWQTDHQGIYMHPGESRTGQRDKAFQFYGEARTDAAGAFRFRTIVPAPYTGRARHIHAKITPPGGQTLTTQFYFKGDSDLAGDRIVRRLGNALESVTLVPKKATDGTETAVITVVVRR